MRINDIISEIAKMFRTLFILRCLFVPTFVPRSCRGLNYTDMSVFTRLSTSSINTPILYFSSKSLDSRTIRQCPSIPSHHATYDRSLPPSVPFFVNTPPRSTPSGTLQPTSPQPQPQTSFPQPPPQPPSTNPPPPENPNQPTAPHSTFSSSTKPPFTPAKPRSASSARHGSGLQA